MDRDPYIFGHTQGLKRERLDSEDETALSSEEELTAYAENRPRRGKKTKVGSTSLIKRLEGIPFIREELKSKWNSSVTS